MSYVNLEIGKICEYEPEKYKERYIEIDELMCPIILLLNNKGYTTEYCCQGHYYEEYPNAYITFAPWVFLPKIPNGWKYNKEVNTIRYNMDKSDNLYEFNINLNMNMYELYSYVKSLNKYYMTREMSRVKDFFTHINEEFSVDNKEFKRYKNRDKLKDRLYKVKDHVYTFLKIYWYCNRQDIYFTEIYYDVIKRYCIDHLFDEDLIDRIDYLTDCKFPQK